MRTIRIIEHISLDGVIQSSGGPLEDGDFPYGDWTAPYRSPAGLAIVLAALCPVLLGKGKRLFADGTPARALTLASTQATPTGITVNMYKAPGPLQNQR